MIGNNEFKLNAATLIDALQAYFNAKFVANPPKVLSVEATSNGYTSDCFFTVKVTNDTP